MTCITCLLFILTAAAQGDISPSTDVEAAFAEADVVCASKISAVTALSREDARDTSGTLAPVDYEVAHTQAWCYKGNVDLGRFTIRIHQVDRAHGQPGGDGKYHLGFFKRTDAGLAPTVLGIALRFPSPPASQNQTGTGLKQLEADVLYIARNGDLDETHDALEFLTKFRHLHPDSISGLVDLARRSDHDTQLLSIEALLKIQTIPNRGDLLHRFAMLLANQSDSDLFPGMFEMDSVIAESSMDDFEALKELANCRYEVIRSFAMDAIRHLRAPGTVPFLVGQLDSPNEAVRYSALITLAEITNKSGDFGPTLTTFRTDPERYAGIWKQWWQEEGARRYAMAH